MFWGKINNYYSLWTEPVIRTELNYTEKEVIYGESDNIKS